MIAPVGQRHAVRFVAVATEQDLEVGVGDDADVGRGELDERRRVLGVAEALADGQRRTPRTSASVPRIR